MKQTSICLIGAGGIAAAHIDAANFLSSSVKITAIADPNLEVAQKLATNLDAKAYTNFEEVLADSAIASTIDAVIICTPPSVRLPIVEAAIKNKMHVLMEKPIASTLEDAEKLTQLAAQNPQITCAIAYCHRFESGITHIKKLVESGDFGRLVRVENTFAAPAPQMKDHWMSDPKVSGGGSLIDTACHSLDMFQYLAGTPELVGAVLFNGWEGRGESNATVLVAATDKSELPVAGTINSGWNEAMRFQVNVVTEKASFAYDYCKPNIVSKQTAGVEGIEEINLGDQPGRFGGQLKAFVEKITNGTESDLATFADGLNVANVIADAQGHTQCECCS
ncbi:Putative 4,5-dihydroxyphthalate dehydrogenase [Poriferisphaera corsica]|uniref:4,5-dihydroxyphthalate dehydrogenase n=1 Tax=Poriferisphaera corsica TaxID=2528020 RepID=A0A517YTR0_9BACT|nr:Gfo/Idh/MocA family oxidoreductase [Poriferisphaera corsica]QDU33624.1 Putative 4,5-dihydroxyphthalate dehydrogenase [Poriferisphaera corsica]